MGNAEERPRDATDRLYRAELNYLCPFLRNLERSVINLTGARLQYKEPQRGGGGWVGFGIEINCE